MKNGALATTLMSVIAILLAAFIGISSTFMWRADDRVYEMQRLQIRQTTILEQQSIIIQDHETRLRTVETGDTFN